MSNSIQTQTQPESGCYPGENKFLHFFELKSKANSFIGLDLYWGVRILTVIFIMLDIGSFFNPSSFLEFILTGFQIFGSSALLYSTFYKSYKWGFIGYFIHMIFFYINVCFGLFIVSFLAGFYFSFKIFLVFLLLFFVFILIKAAILWIFYSYIVDLKQSGDVREIQTTELREETNENCVNTNNNA